MIEQDNQACAIVKMLHKLGYDEINVEGDNLKIYARRNVAPSKRSAFEEEINQKTPSAPTTVGETKSLAPLAARTELAEIRTPMLGIFYRASSPGAEPFIAIGDVVTAETTIGVVEVMKLFSPIHAGLSGVVVQILPDNGSMVESGQVIALIDTSAIAS